MADFLLEIGTEEIPSRMIEGLVTELSDRLAAGLEAERLPGGRLRQIAAARRFGCLIEGLPERQEDRVEEIRGPPLAVARDAFGKWTQAALGFVRKQAADPSDLLEMEGLKGPCVGLRRPVKGQATASILSRLVPEAVEALHLPKTMRWGSGENQFVRPVRWVVALLDGEVVPMAVKGVGSGRLSRGHRIHGSDSVAIPSEGDYFEILRREFVIADPLERRGRLEGQLSREAEAAGGTWRDGSSETADLLDTVTYMSEYPTVLAGGIPREFTSLPSKILSTCLREHQHFFAVHAAGAEEEGIRPSFLAVIDGPGDPSGKIRRGNENVTLSRLADARFFYRHDVEVPLERRLEELRGIVFHPRCGTYRDKVGRIEGYARKLAEAWGVDPDAAARAARLCKSDLASLLVQEKEFTDLQGIAGGLYASAQGEPPEVAEAIRVHYDPVPKSGIAGEGMSEGRILGGVGALADRLDTLIQMFRIGLVPSGSKDPFALRRAAAQVVHLLEGVGFVPLERRPRIHLADLLESWYGEGREGLLDFLRDRLRFKWEQDRPAAPAGADPADRFEYDEINAVLSGGLGILPDMRERLEAVHQVRKEFPADFDALSVAFKRSRNILKGMPPFDLDPGRFLPEADREGAGERALHGAYERVRLEAEQLADAGRYADALRVLATVRPAVDQFYDDVLVMCDPEGKDPEKAALQRNRLALLRRLAALFDRIADFSEIVPREA